MNGLHIMAGLFFAEIMVPVLVVAWLMSKGDE